MTKVYPGAAVGGAQVVSGQQLIEDVNVREYPLRLSDLQVIARNVLADSGLGLPQVIGRMHLVDVRDYDTSVPLGFESMEHKLDLAYADAKTQVNAYGAMANIYDVYVPAGAYRFTTRKVRRGTNGAAFISPGIVGAGKYQTTFVVDSDLGGYSIEYAPSSPSEDPAGSYQLGPRLEGFTILNTSGGRGGGIKLPYSVLGSLRDVRVRGFSANQDYELGWGLWIGKSSDYGPFELVPQEIYIADCDFNYNQGGIFATEVNGANQWDRVQLGGCQWLGMAFDGALFSLNGAELQAGTPNGYWYSGPYSMGMASAWTHEMLTGSGASVAVQSSGRTLVSGLSGLTAASHQWTWLELGGGAEPRGVYVIDQVVSPSSCWIRKGSAHAAEAGLAWRVLGTRGGNRVQIAGAVYREVSKRVGLMVTKDVLTSSDYELTPRVFGNCDYAVEARQCAGHLRLGSMHGATKALLATECARVDVDTQISRVDVDDHTRVRMRAFRDDQSTYLGGVPEGLTLSAVVQSIGVAEEVDPARRGAVSSSGGLVNAITGLRGTVFVPRGATKPTFTAADANFAGQPSWTNVDGSASTAGLLVGTIAASLMKADTGEGSLAGMVLVARLPDISAPPGTGKVRRVQVSAGESSSFVGFHDDVYSTAPYYGALYHADIPGTIVAPQGATVFDPGDTLPHVVVVTWPVEAQARVYIDGVRYDVGGSKTWYRRTPLIDAGVAIGAYAGIGALALDIAYLAVLRQSPSEREAKAITDAARVRFGIV